MQPLFIGSANAIERVLEDYLEDIVFAIPCPIAAAKVDGPILGQIAGTPAV
jgi:hypothetical protein